MGQGTQAHVFLASLVVQLEIATTNPNCHYNTQWIVTMSGKEEAALATMAVAQVGSSTINSSGWT